MRNRFICENPAIANNHLRGLASTALSLSNQNMRDLFIEGLRICQHLEDTPEGESQVEANWLFFPEVKTLGVEPPKSFRRAQEKLLQQILEHSDADELARRIVPDSDIVQEQITVPLEPPKEVPLWGTPLELVFPYLIWEQNRIRIAYVPSLGIEIPIPNAREKDEVIEDQIRFALNRRRINHRLFDLSLLQRCRDLEIERIKWNVYPLSPKERTMREEGDEGNVEPVLGKVGKRIDTGKTDPIFEREVQIEQIATLLKGKRGITSLLLVGENGVGKTALIKNFAKVQKNLGLVPKQVYHTPGSKIVAGMTGFGEWQERCRKMALEASSGKGKMLYFGNLLEILEVGQSASNSESVGSFFRPWLIRGQFVAIAECTPAQLSHIEQKDPRMLEAFRQIKIEPPSDKVSLTILRKVVTLSKDRVSLSPATLKRIFTLHQRYAGYSAMPGKMLYFTRRLIHQNEAKGRAAELKKIPPSAVNQLFALETGLPDFLLDDSAPLDLEKVTHWFKQRIKGQDGAIGHVVDTIAGIKARLTRPQRPLGSFLFVGPTGVGKTELAKTLAKFFYGSPDRLLRIDMSEYSSPGSAGRLASGGPGEPEGILTSKMRDQPFSVVLLDEFEKAHSSVFDLFLQVLGEARLTDGAGRLADFSNAMIIMTSNLGAAEFRAVAPGFGDRDLGIETLAIDHFVAAAKKRFRPEFFNRIGRIVPFLPLDDESTREVIVREIGKLDRRDGLKNREITLMVEDEVIDALVKGGFDPRYGARPLKRTIEAKLLKPIGEYLIEHPQVSSGTIDVYSLDSRGRLDFRYRSEEEERDKAEKSELKDWNERIPNLRRWYQILNNSHLISELHSEVRRLERKVKFKPGPRDHEFLANSRKLLERLDEDSAEVYQLEENLLITAFENASLTQLGEAIEAAPDWNDFCDLLRDVYQWIQRSAPRIMVLLTSDNPAILSRFAAVYREVGRELGSRVKVGYYREKPGNEDLDPVREGCRKPYLPEAEQEIESLFSGKLPNNCAGIVLEFSKPQIGLKLNQEMGVHRYIDNDGEQHHVRLVGYDDEEMTIEKGYITDETILNRNYKDAPIRRTWNEQECCMIDEVWGSSVDSEKIDPRDLPPEFDVEAVVTLIELTLIDRALETIRS